MQEKTPHTLRFAFLLALVVVALVVVAFDQLRSQGVPEQQAAVLRIYDK